MLRALANHAGLRDTARAWPGQNIAAFPLDQVEAIIITQAGCGAMLKEYPLLVDGAEEFSSKVKISRNFWFQLVFLPV